MRNDLERKPVDAGKLDHDCDGSVDDGGRLELNIRKIQAFVKY